MFTEKHEGTSHILLEMPHSGTGGMHYKDARATDGLPPVIARNIRFESEEVRKTIGYGCDAAAPIISGYRQLLAELPVSGVRNRLARAFVDPNRGLEEVSGHARDGFDTQVHNHGLIWARTVVAGLTTEQLTDPLLVTEAYRAQSEAMLRHPYDAEQFDELLELAYKPYHAAIREAHERIVNARRKVIHLALHTMPPLSVTKVDGAYVCGPPADRGPFDAARNTLPDVLLIHNGYKAADRRYVEVIAGTFRKHGLVVEDGKGPFLGNNGVTGLYGRPDDGVHVIGIEHVAHDGLEPERHLGKASVDAAVAKKYRRAYREAVEALLLF